MPSPDDQGHHHAPHTRSAPGPLRARCPLQQRNIQPYLGRRHHPCPAAQPLERLQREMPGQVLEVELEQKRGLWIYEIKLLTPAGQLTKVLLDAQTAQVLRVQARDDKSQRRDERPRR